MYTRRPYLMLIFAVWFYCIGVSSQSSPFLKTKPTIKQIPEDAKIGSPLFTFTVTDSDTFDNITIKSGNPLTTELVTITKTCKVGCSTVVVNITLNETLDFENPPGHKTSVDLLFFATDKTNNKIRIPCYLYIIDLNDNSPVFNTQQYTWNVKENITTGSNYTEIKATDKDTGNKGYVTYDLKTSETNAEYAKTFTMDSRNGVVTLQKDLDYETNTYYQFQVIAKDGYGLNTTVDFIVRVQDVQDTPPFFTGMSYRTSIDENIKLNSTVITVTAVDGDHGVPNNITYSIDESNQGDCSDLFTINEHNGTISTKTEIDRDSGKVKILSGACVLKVQAGEINDTKNQQYGNTTTTSNVYITIIDKNDNKPTFNSSTYTATVPENTAENVPITFTTPVIVHDNDQQECFSKMHLYLMYNDTTNCSDFEPSPPTVTGTGQVMILVKNQKLLDYEKEEHITLKIIATEVHNHTRNATATVNITLLNIDDNSPTFVNDSYEFYVNESSVNRTHVQNLTATDADLDKKLTYSISGGNNRFIVDKTTGEIYVNCSNCEVELDREIRDMYFMTYTATDSGGRSNSVSLVIHLKDINDNPPVFRRDDYNKYIKENNKTSLVTVLADDKDCGNNSRIEYEIINVTPHDMIHNVTVDQVNGTLTLNHSVDYEKLNGSSAFTITVEAKDFGTPSLNSTTTIQITVEDENDNSPIFNKTTYTGCIQENITSENGNQSEVTQVYAYDLDGTQRNKEFHYFIAEGAFERFTINSSTGVVSVQRNVILDREQTPEYNISIIAIDQGSPPHTSSATLHIDILDVNDAYPAFDEQHYAMTVTENSSIGTSVMTCYAKDSDEDNNLVYSIVNVTGKDENGKDVNSSIIQNYFSIDNSNGTIYINSSLNREVVQRITLTLNVTDTNAFSPRPQNGQATLVMTLKDVNDNPPTFGSKNYTEHISENARESSILTTIKATDADVNRTISYSLIQENNTKSEFSIDPETGVITKNGTIDREKDSLIRLIITATDNGVPPKSSTATVLVNVDDFNDNPPVFTAPVINETHVFENVNNGTVVLQMNATDADIGPNDNITFSIENEDKSDFRINKTTGAISVFKSPDRETQDTYTLYVVAKDNPERIEEQKTARTVVKIIIDDCNDNAPTFHGSNNGYVKENVENGTHIITLTATDLDKENNSRLSYSIKNDTSSGLFTIGRTSGIIRTNMSLLGHVGLYVIGVIAEDNGTPKKKNTTYVNITVQDVNLNKPVIGNIPPHSTISIYECVPRGYIVYTFNYTDADHGNNTKADFAINTVGDNSSLINAFKMYKNGSLATNTTLDVNKQSEYKFQVQATDFGSPRLPSTKQLIVIKILDVNDHLPTFTKTNNTMKVNENASIGDIVGSVKAIDEDKDSRPCYNITGIAGLGMGMFNIGRQTGVINTTTVLDYEAKSKFTLKVHVYDCDVSQTTSDICNITKRQPDGYTPDMEITINVEDVNDNPPVFIEKIMYTGMRITTEAGSALDLQLKNGTYVRDRDSPKNGKLSWSFGNAGNISISDNLKDKITPKSGVKPCNDGEKHLFCVTGNGTIINNKYFSEDLSGYFIVPVKVSDEAGNDTAQIKIYLIGNSQILVMTVMHSKEIVSQQKDEIMSEYSKVTGYHFVYDFLLDHKTRNGELNTQQSDLYFHVVNDKTQDVLSATEAQRMVDGFYKDLIPVMSSYKTQEIISSTKMTKLIEDSPQKTIYIMAAVIVALTLTITIIIYVSVVTKNKYKRKLKAATIKTYDKDLEKNENKNAIPGSNMYSKQSNPLLNANVEEKVDAHYDDVSLDSHNSLDTNDVDNPRHETTYDTMEEREMTMDMFTEDTFVASNGESALDAALKMHEMQQLGTDDENTSGNIAGSYDGQNSFDNNAYDEEIECTEI